MTTALRAALVCINYSPEQTGIGPFSRDLAEGLTARDWDVTVVTSYPHYPSWVRSDDWAEHDAEAATRGIRIRRCKHRVPRKPARLNRLLMETSFGIRAAAATPSDADLVICIVPSLFSAFYTVLRERLRFGRRRPVVIWSQDLYGRGLAEAAGHETRFSRLMSVLEGWVLRSATRVAVIHERFADIVVEDLGVRREDITVLRNWSRSEPLPPATRTEALAALGWSDLADRSIVVHAGSMGAKQDLPNVVDAARLAEESGAPVTFVLVGDGACREDLEEQAAGLSAAIRFPGLLDAEPFALALRAADFLLVNQSPDVADMCVPSKLLTYYQAERPIIAAASSRSIAAVEVLRSGSGIVVAPSAPADLIAGVLDLAARDRDELAALSVAGRVAIESEFDRGAIITEFDTWLRTTVLSADAAVRR